MNSVSTQMKLNGEGDSQREADKGACFFQSLNPTAFDKGPVREGAVVICFHEQETRSSSLGFEGNGEG